MAHLEVERQDLTPCLTSGEVAEESPAWSSAMGQHL